MPRDDLNESEIVALFEGHQDSFGLRSAHENTGRELLVRLRRAAEQEGVASGRRVVTLVFYGTGAHLADFDGVYDWADFAYTRDDQAESVLTLCEVAARYLRGEGETVVTSRRIRRDEVFLVIPLGDRQDARLRRRRP